MTNVGPGVATNVVVSDPLPSSLAFTGATTVSGTYANGVWSAGDLAPGQSAILHLTATVINGATEAS